ncbi:hypothetical protein DFJ74DRAFT_684816 [Hyaloraphidium curvatum]|nr:hypothetical protein DFJ74DRAFT_684816 [Hyaloraphidium curvatum]
MDHQKSIVSFELRAPRAKVLLAAAVLDVAFLVLMAVSGAGPLGNQSLYWGHYSNARIPNNLAATDLWTGIWGTVRENSMMIVSSNWWNDPYFSPIYGNAYFYAMVTLQVVAGTTLCFGALTLVLMNPVPLMLASVFSTAVYIPVFGMMAWLNADVGTKIAPYSSYSSGPGLACGAAALGCALLSTGIKFLVTRMPPAAVSSAEREKEALERGPPSPKGEVAEGLQKPVQL